MKLAFLQIELLLMIVVVFSTHARRAGARRILLQRIDQRAFELISMQMHPHDEK